jgi:electron transfer flavoprotein alpha subunit
LNAIWVIAEEDSRGVRDAALEVIGEGRALADQLRARLHVIALGDSTGHLVEPLTHQDVDAIYLVSHPLLHPYSSGGYVTALAQLFQEEQLSGPVLISATALGSDLAPRLAAHLKVPLAADCIWVKAGPAGDLRLIQPIHQDRAHLTLSCPADTPLIASLRPGSIGMDQPKRSRVPAIIHFNPQLDSTQIRTHILESVPGDPRQMDLSEADLIVSGGFGVRDKESWRALEALADELGAAVGGSRVAMDLGYIPRKHMIGQTGAWIRPRLYLAAGISGASHHVGGVKADAFIAINLDKHAPIFKQGSLNVVGDLHEILPRLIQKIRQAKSRSE